MKGDGRIFKRPRSPFWWVAYWDGLKEHRESSKSLKRSAAKDLLKSRLREILKGTFVPGEQRSITVKELLDQLISNHERLGRKGAKVLKFQIIPLIKVFGSDRATDIRKVRLDRYVEARLAEKAAPATVNKELGALRRAYRLAIEDEIITYVPKFRMLEVRNARQGFVERADFEAIAAGLPEDLRDLSRFAFFTGWRKGEITSLEWGDVDLQGGEIRLRAENAKTGFARRVAVVGGLRELLERRAAAMAVTGADGVTTIAPFVFHRGDGHRIKDFRGAWMKATTAAGMPHILFHDLRRSAIRSMVRAGVPETVAMAISGHRTRSVFDRYNVSSGRDLVEAMEKTLSYLGNQPSERSVIAGPKPAPTRDQA